MRSELLQGIANIIGNYRSGELPRSLDKDHVDKWACQFSKLIALPHNIGGYTKS